MWKRKFGVKKPRKRQRQPEKWARVIKKKAHARGERYTNTKGNVTQQKSIGPDCNCKRKCFEKSGNDHISLLFRQFYELGDTAKQDMFLFGKIRREAIKRHRPRSENTETKRSASFKYFVTSSAGQDIEICQKAFRSVHGIGKTRFEKLRKKDPELLTDKRGKHGNQRKIDEDVNDKVKTHISSSPSRKSHYSRRKNPDKVYISEDLNIQRMWTVYLQIHEPEQYLLLQRGMKANMNPSVKYASYKHIFDTEFNIGFGSPRSDTCLKCDQLEQEVEALKAAGDVEGLEAKENERRLHHTKADNGYELLSNKAKETKLKDHVDCYTFDFQQNLPLPKLTTNDMFYARQLWLYNFGVHDCKVDDGIMHVWHEGIAGRGSSEVCSCLDKVLRGNRRATTHLYLFSDGCVGQNKNRALVVFLQSLVEANIYKRIDHIFLYRGHTFLPNDRDFGLIEKRKNATPKVELPSEYVKMIMKSRHAKPFMVHEMKGEDILDFKDVSDRCMSKTTLKDKAGVKLHFNDVHWFSYGKSENINDKCTGSSVEEHKGEVWCRYTHNVMESWKKVNIFKRGVSSVPNPALKYHHPLGIKDPKYKDLMTLCDKNLLQQPAIDFFRSLKPESMTQERVRGNESESDSDYID